MLKLIVLKRVKPIPFSGVLIPVVSLVAGILLSTLILYVLAGIPPLGIFNSIKESFVAPTVVKDTLILTLVGISLVIAFTGAIWNIGSEGQIHMGMMFATWVALFSALSTMPLWAKIVSVLGAAVFGFMWAAIAGFLRAYTKVDEVPVTLMMNYIAYYILDILVYGPWKGKRTYGYIRTDEIAEPLRFQQLTIFNVKTTATWEALILVIIVFIVTWILLRYTTLGLRIRILGSNPDILKSAGISVPLTIVLALAISGLVSGIVGATYVLGDTYRLSYPLEEHTAGYGYLGILVAWLSMLDLRGVPIAAYIVSALRNTGTVIQIAGLGGVGTMFVFIGSVLLTYSIVRIFSEYTIKIVVKR